MQFEDWNKSLFVVKQVCAVKCKAFRFKIVTLSTLFQYLSQRDKIT